jgi:thiamine kinase-like enzyme
MIPQEKSEGVTRGLREAFGVSTFDDIQMLTRGLSGALVYRIVVGGSKFLLRIVTRTPDPTLPQHFACMKQAAEAGLAPHVWYTSVEDRISITDFVDNVPFPISEALVQMPAALRALHALPPFPRRANHLNTSCTFLIHGGTALNTFIEKFQSANILSKSESEHLFAWHARLAAAYPPNESDMASSHNDLFRPDNILFDSRRVWLVDWEAAFLNDRYADLAVVADFVASNDSEERAYLQVYFGRSPDEYELARFIVMRQMVHMFYAMGFLWLSSAAGPVNLAESVPEFRDFHRQLWAGELNLADKQTKALYGRVHWNQFLQDVQHPRSQEALKIVSDRHRLT